tara:strand:- start:128 stop:388 length:261 start_codon:yes stop_codon:yes gene_type:complete
MVEYIPRISDETCHALIEDYNESGYLERILRDVWEDNPVLVNFIEEHFGNRDKEGLGDVYEAMLLTYRLLHNQVESDILDAAYHSS